MNTAILLMYILIGIGVLGLLSIIYQLFKIKIWISIKNRRDGKFTQIGFMNLNDQYEVPEVHLTDKIKGAAIGRIKMGEKDDNSYVEVLITDVDDESVKPQYKTCGYITQEGYIYKLREKGKKPEMIGYTARPSNPDEPTSIGERTWKSLWLKCKLNVYLGFPSNESKGMNDTDSNVSFADSRITNQPIVLGSTERSNVVDGDESSSVPFDISNTKDFMDETADAAVPTESDQSFSLKDTDELKDDSETVDNVSESDPNRSKDSKGEDRQEQKRTKKGKEKKNKGKEKAKRKASIRIPDVVASYMGIHSSRNDNLPPEAKAAAYGVFFQMYNKNDYREHYASPAFGWKDTALLSAFIYAVLYCFWYILNVKLLGFRFIGYKFWKDIPLYFAFYALWAIVRAIKIECIEKSDTIQNQLDLFNKILGQRWMDVLIIFCCTITILFTGTYYRFDFLPLAAVLMTAVIINMSLKASKRPWMTKNPFAADEEEIDENILENPKGDIERDYIWELDSPNKKNVKGDLSLYFDSQYIMDLRFMNPFFSQRKDKSTAALIKNMFQYIKSHKSVSARSRYVVKRIEEISRQKGLSQEDTLQFILDFVQEPNIRFVMNTDSSAIQKYDAYIRYPDEVLYDKEADSNSKAFLAAVLLHYMRHNVLFLYSRHQHHGAIGIEVSQKWISNGFLFEKPVEEVTFKHNGKIYIFCETTADGFRIGGTMGGMKPDDFDERVEIPIVEKDSEDTNDESVTRMYRWSLDSAEGNELEGLVTIEFNVSDIESLRDANPFINYGSDGKTYADNIRTMFKYLEQMPEKNKYVSEIAAYINRQVKEKGFSDLDLIQFTLDFCQEPNISYKIDELSESIGFAKEYMRFPDEVLFDKEGDCDCKSSLAMALFKQLGYKVVFLMSEKHGHAAVGVECNPEWNDKIGIQNEDTVIKEYNGVKYVYCETTGDNFKVGQIKEPHSIQDFEIIEV